MNLSKLLTKTEIKLEDVRFRYKDLIQHPRLYSKKDKTKILSQVKYFKKKGMIVEPDWCLLD